MGILPKALTKVFTEDDYDREISDYYRAKSAQQGSLAAKGEHLPFSLRHGYILNLAQAQLCLAIFRIA